MQIEKSCGTSSMRCQQQCLLGVDSVRAQSDSLF
jgi:hypothetical protein